MSLARQSYSAFQCHGLIFCLILLIYGNLMCALGALLNWSGQTLLKSFQPFSDIGCIHQLGRLEGGGRTRGECFRIGHYSLCHILVSLKSLTCI